MMSEPTTTAAEPVSVTEPAKLKGSTRTQIARRAAAPATGRPTLPATDAADSDQPLTLSADAIEGTRDRALAMDWTDDGHIVRRRDDGVYERVHAPTVELPAAPETYEFYPNVEMLDRRVLDPAINKDIPILFSDEQPGKPQKYYKRWVDTWVPHRLLTLTQSAMYKQAEWSMLKNQAEIGDRYEGTKTDNYVRRGEKGRYMLLFMPYAKWLEIKTAQAKIRTKREQTEMARVAAHHAPAAGINSQAAEQIESSFRGTIRELPPQSVESFQGSGLPKDISSGDGVTVLEQ